MRRLSIIALVILGIVGTTTTAHAADGWSRYRDHYVHWHTSLEAPPLFPDQGPGPFNAYAKARARAVLIAQRANDRYRAALAAAAARVAAARSPAPSLGTAYTGSIAALIRSVFGRIAPGYVGLGLCVANRESRFQATAYNPSGASGVFQFMPTTWRVLSARYGWGGYSAFNAVANVTVAAETFAHGGSGNWHGDCGL